MQEAQREEHRWLERFVGEWTVESEMTVQPGQPPETHAGSEQVRSIGGVWVVCEGLGEMPGGEMGTTLMTLGYDPARGRFVGTFVGSMMTHLWIYEGTLDDAGTMLTLDTEGPSFTAEGELGKYRDTMAFESDDHRVFTSHYLGGDGEWHAFMTAHYRRTG